MKKLFLVLFVVIYIFSIITLLSASNEFWACFDKGDRINYCDNYKLSETCTDSGGCQYCMSVYDKNKNCYIHGSWPKCLKLDFECSDIQDSIIQEITTNNNSTNQNNNTNNDNPNPNPNNDNTNNNQNTNENTNTPTNPVSNLNNPKSTTGIQTGSFLSTKISTNSSNDKDEDNLIPDSDNLNNSQNSNRGIFFTLFAFTILELIALSGLYYYSMNKNKLKVKK